MRHALREGARTGGSSRPRRPELTRRAVHPAVPGLQVVQVDQVLAAAESATRGRTRGETSVFDGLSDPTPLWFELSGLDV